MKFTIDAIVIPNGVYALCEGPVADTLVYHTDLTLVSATWSDLLSTGDRAPAVVGDDAASCVVASDVCIDTAWTVSGAQGKAYVARKGELQVVELDGMRAVRRIHVAHLGPGSFAAAVDAECRRVLLVVERTVNPDFSEYSLAMVDLASGGLTEDAAGCGEIDLQVVWSTRLATWLIGATAGGALWRWDGSGPKVLLADPSPEVYASTLTCDEDGAILATRLTESEHGDVLLTAGHASSQGVNWSPPVIVGPGVTCAVRSPARPVWACLRESGTGRILQLLDGSGAVLVETSSSPAYRLDRLYWSRYSADRLWGIGRHTLAAVTVHN